ncbi:MAG TPA: CorA family divalent cation transporter [Methylocystis sp.]|nr:CorA family divalent cation transporter [Methylocystis sp.]
MTTDRLKAALESDIPGCLFALRFDDEGRAEPGGAADVDRIGAPGEGFVWLHLDLNDPRVHALLARLAFLDENARKTLLGPIDAQFIEHSGDVVRGAFVDHERTIVGRIPQTGYLRFAVGERFLISARDRPLSAVESTRVALSAGFLAETPLDLFETIVGHLCDELGKMIYELTLALDRIEEHIVGDGKGPRERTALGATRRAALRLAREVNGLRSPLLRLEATLSEPEQEDLKELGGRLSRRAEILAHDLAEVQDRARLLQDELNAIAGLVTNDRLYVLTVVTTLLLPATFVTGFFGMNTKSLPFTEIDYGTAYAGALCLAASLVAFVIIRRMGLTRPRDGDEGSKPPRS